MPRPLEIVLFTIVNFLPYLLLELFAFRYSMRFSLPLTVSMVAGLSILQASLGLLIAPRISPGFFSFSGTVLSGLFFLIAARDMLGKKLFILFMIANDANLAITATECILISFLPRQAAVPYHWSYSAILLGMELLILSPMFAYVHKVYANSIDQKRQFNAWNYLWLIPCMFYSIWLCLFRFGPETLGTQTNSLQFFLVTLMLCLGGIFVYSMVAQLIQEHIANVELREKEYKLSMQQAQYDHLQERIYEARKAKHDLRHHLHLASAYLHDGKLEELREYLHRFSESIPDDRHISYCDHYASNALLVYFAWQAKEAEIQYTTAVDLPASVGIPDEVLTIVLGNLLENAIAACREERGTSPWISVRGKIDDSAVFFQISNTCTRKLKRNPSGQYASTKPSGLGIGLRSVQDIADQYDGLMETRQNSDVFTVSIMLTIPEK